MPVKGNQGSEEHQQWKLSCSPPFQISGQTQLMVEQRILTEV